MGKNDGREVKDAFMIKPEESIFLFEVIKKRLQEVGVKFHTKPNHAVFPSKKTVYPEDIHIGNVLLNGSEYDVQIQGGNGGITILCIEYPPNLADPTFDPRKWAKSIVDTVIEFQNSSNHTFSGLGSLTE